VGQGGDMIVYAALHRFYSKELFGGQEMGRADRRIFTFWLCNLLSAGASHAVHRSSFVTRSSTPKVKPRRVLHEVARCLATPTLGEQPTVASAPVRWTGT
jgi:hypothetical protein